jgi:enterobacteria phage integrase
VTKNKRVATQRQRLTLEDFQRIHAASPIHLQNALDLGLITLQRREDLVSFSWSDLRDGVLELQQHKTGTRLRITVTKPLARVLDTCRSNLDSPWIIHYRRGSPHTRAGDPIAKQQLSSMFRAVRDSLGLYAELPIRQRPSFHEIRSLGARLYEARGMDPQTLLGHKSRQMTEVYLDSRREEWLVASPAVDILENFRESFDNPS